MHTSTVQASAALAHARAVTPTGRPVCYTPENNYTEVVRGPEGASTGAPTPTSGVTLISITSGLPSAFVSCMRENRLAYARAHGFEFCEFRSKLNRQDSFSRQKCVPLRVHYVRTLDV